MDCEWNIQHSVLGSVGEEGVDQIFTNSIYKMYDSYDDDVDDDDDYGDNEHDNGTKRLTRMILFLYQTSST